MKSLNFTLLLIIVSLLTKTSSAQLSGTYTIGGTTPDYSTLQAAATAVQTAGVSGAVVFNIRPGTYNGKVDIGNIAGTSATNTVTFKSENNDSSSVIITDTASGSNGNFIFHIFGTDYLIIRNLTFHRIGPHENSCIFSIALNSRFLQIKNNVIESDVTTSFDPSSSLAYLPLVGANDSSITFSNNLFKNGSYAIYIQGQGTSSRIPLTLINNNIFSEQSYYAVRMAMVSAPIIRNNVITTISGTFGYTGISIEDCIHDFKITANKISGVESGNAVYLQFCKGDIATPGLVANNFIHAQGPNSSNGISINQSSYLNLYYNSVNITSANNFAAAVSINNSATDSMINIKNNILTCPGSGLIFYLSGNNSFNSIENSDYNDLYMNPSSAEFAFMDTGYADNFAHWKTATSMDSHSVSGDPQFISDIDMHAGNAIVNNAGVFIAAVTTDIDGQTRSNTTPDIGADEFVPLLNNVGLLSFVSPKTGQCGDSSTVLAMVIHNYGSNTQTSFPMHAEITGLVTQSLTQNYSGSLATNGNDTVIFTQFINTYAGGTIDVTAYLSLGSDQYRDNDTIHATFTFNGHPNPLTVVSPQQQCDNNIQITATPDSGDVAAWFADPVGGDLLFAGNVFSPTITSDTTFYVEARQGSGSGGCLRITEIQPDDNPSDFIEVQNLSGVGFDATGWKVVVNDNYDDTIPNPTMWNLGYFGPGEVQYKTDNSSDHYWGSNLTWSSGLGSWAMIIDNSGNIADFIIWDWDEITLPIPTMVINVDGVNYTVGDQWTGPAITSCNFPNSAMRIGDEDHNSLLDWGCDISNLGLLNQNLSSVFNNCGIGACGSQRFPVDVTLVPGISVNLGNDTLVGQPFAITLDPGAGFTSYLWSTGHTTQSIIVSAYDTYWVTVTGGANNCSFTDTIVISLNVGTENLISENEINLYPNPSSDKLSISARGNILKSADVHITDINGRLIEVPGLDGKSGELMLDIANLNEGIYFLHIISGNRTGVKRFTVIK